MSKRSRSCFLCCFPTENTCLPQSDSEVFNLVPKPVSLLLPATAEISLEISQPHICPGLLSKLELGGSLHKEIWDQTVCKDKTNRSWRRMTEVTKCWRNE